MKILLVRTIAIENDCSDKTYNTQGIGLATELSRLGNECGLVYYAKKGNGFTETIESDDYKIKVYHIEGKNFVWNAIYNNELYKICEEYDIIQTSECDQIASWSIYKRFPNKTLIYHGPYKSKYTKKYNLRSRVFDLIFASRNSFKNAKVITKSKLGEDYLRKKGFRDITTLGVGLNPYFLEQKNTEIPKEILELQQNKKNSKYILFIGAISKRKNLKFIIEVLNELVNKRGLKEYKLVVIGSRAYKEDKYYNECFEMIMINQLENNVVYLGKVEQSNLKNVYECCDTYVLPTQYDIFGMVYLEAMYFGIPIVTTMCGGSSLLIKNEKTGYILELGRIAEWADAITKICNNSDLKKKISNETRELIRNQFLWEKLAPKFIEQYKKVGKSL